MMTPDADKTQWAQVYQIMAKACPQQTKHLLDDIRRSAPIIVKERQHHDA